MTACDTLYACHGRLSMNARVCVVGAGSSGIAAAQVLHDRGVDFDCFELGSE